MKKTNVITFIFMVLLVSSYLCGETISGTVTLDGSGLENVVMTGLPGSPATDLTGYYIGTVDTNWSGTVTPVLACYSFTPVSIVYTNVTTDYVDQNYTALLLTYTISGTILTEYGVGSENVEMIGMPDPTFTDANGDYIATVDCGWSGTVRPRLEGFRFSPAIVDYTDVQSDQIDQDYTARISFDSPSDYQVIVDSIWAPASGGGTWMTEVQITDRSGGSFVSVYFTPRGDSLRGPFPLWMGTTENNSIKYDNILQTISALDPTYDYFGRVGALEFVTQTSDKRIHTSARLYNGNFSKTVQGLNYVDTNTAAITRQMVIQDLVSNSLYRSSVGLFNPTFEPVTVELSVRDSTNSIIGSAFTRIMSPNSYTSFNPFVEAGVPYPGDSYDNTFILINPTIGLGTVMCFGVTVNNITNDPAAHLAIQALPKFENSPWDYQVLPEVIWAPATGFGTWVTSVQVIDYYGGSEVSAYFTPSGESRRGPFLLWTSPGFFNSWKSYNIMNDLAALDTGYDYFGKVGALEFITQDSDHVINAIARTVNGNYSKTFQGINYVDANFAHLYQQMIVQNMVSNDPYRSAVGVFNLTTDPLTVEFSLIDGDGNIIGSVFTRTIAGNGFLSVNPFTQAGVPHPSYSYDNVWVYINPISGDGEIMCFGATSNNFSNDPSAHIAVQYR